MLDRYKEEFLNPSSEFSPFPFWFWNDVLDKEEINRQMCAFKEKGIDGFVLHPRIGLPEELGYLSDEFMVYVKYAVKRATELNMKVILYDEGMYPSGSAHGQVVRQHPEFASKGLRKSTIDTLGSNEELVACIDWNQKTGERVVAEGALKEGFERYYFIMTESNGTIRGIHYGEDDGESNAPKSTDLLNPKATQCFIELTHQRYYDCLSEYFGGTVIAMFTDEPNILGRCSKEGLIPWTNGFLEYYLEQDGKVTDLPLLFEDQIVSEPRSTYKRAINKLLSEAFYGPIAKWCKTHQIMLTGHPESSEDIGLLDDFDLPCQDIVWRYVAPEEAKGVTGSHSTMGKCSSDAARHHNKRRNGNECCGCCSPIDNPYFFSREDMKWYLDWLFVRGVNLIIPHAFFYSMRDRRKDERPPDVGMNSMFWEEYHEITDYIKRMSQLLTDSINVTDIAILCTQDKLPWEIARPLYENQIEFNYLQEDLLPLCTIKDGAIKIAKQSYRMILIDPSYNYNEVFQKYLNQFQEQGGIILHVAADAVVEEVRKHTENDLKVEDYSPFLRKTHIRKGKMEFILLTNEGEEQICTNLHLTSAKAAEVWDAERGEIRGLSELSDTILLKLARRGSLIIVLKC